MTSLDRTNRDLRLVAGTPGELRAELLDAVFRLRYDVFHTQLGWQVSAEEGRERDEFDAAGTQYVLAVDDDRVLGTCRLVSTTGPYMIRDVFPAALGGLVPPSSQGMWEMSRLAVAPGQPFAEGLGTVAVSVIAAALDRIDELGGDTMLVFSHRDVERKIRDAGFAVERLAPPIRIEGKACTAYTLAARAR